MSQKNIHTQQLNQTPFSQFKPLFSALCAPEIHSLCGMYRAEFTGPAWLRKSAGPSLALAGMGGWCGKEFYADGTAVNLVSHGRQMHRVFPMRLVTLASLVDGKPGMTVQYIQGCPFPWPYIIDELRRLDENCLLGLTIINVGILRKLAFPFLLQVQEHAYGL